MPQLLLALIEKKKLLLILNRLVLGGQSMDAVSMAHHLAQHYDVVIVYGQKEKDEEEAPFLIDKYPELTFIKVDSMRRSILPFQDFKALRDIYSIIKKHRFHIVHTHGFKSGFLGRITAWIAHVPVIIHTYHGHLFHSYYNKFKSGIVCFVERMLGKISTCITAISPQQSWEIYNVYHIAPLYKIKTIYIGVDINNYPLPAPNTPSFRQRYGVANTTVSIGIIGRLVPIKNHSFFVSVIRQLKEQNEDVCFFVIGDGFCKKPMQKEMDSKGITWQEGSNAATQSNVYFTSWVTDIAGALQSLDIVVLTSLNEGTPLTLIEAQLFERPVVSTNVGGVRDTIIDNETGFLINNFSVADFAAKVQLLIHDPVLRAQMGAKGKTFVQQRFSKISEANAIHQLYQDCLTLKNIPA